MKTFDQQNGSSTCCVQCQTALPADAACCPNCGTAIGTDASQSAMHTIGELQTLDPSNITGGTTQDHDLEAGALFADRYTIEEKIGSGGMGVVYRAIDNQNQQTVALKLIRPGRGSDQGIERLKQEGLTTRDIRHKNVVAVYDVNESQGQPFITMEYLDGRSLRQWHNAWKEVSASVPMNKVRQIIEQLLAGLSAAHEAGVIHRDLKPENIIVTTDTEHSVQVKILDFGIARAIRSGVSSTGPMGTARYMAPEQLTSAELAGPSADLYALSVIFYELLVDVLPTELRQPPSTGRTDVPPLVDQLIDQGLSSRPANRMQSAEEYASRLKAISFETKQNTNQPTPLNQAASLNQPASLEKLPQLQSFINSDWSSPAKIISVIVGVCFMLFAGFVMLIVIALSVDPDPPTDYDVDPEQGQMQPWDDQDYIPPQGFQNFPQQGYQNYPHPGFGSGF